jgi:hypothetical protein
MGRIFDSGRKIFLAVAMVVLPMAAGGGVLLSSSPAGATCVPGIGEQVQAVFNATPLTQASVASPGAVLEYQVVVNSLGCDLSAATVNFITPDGSNHVLATNVSLGAGLSLTYYTNNNVGGATPVATPFTYTVNAADIGMTNGDPGGGSLPAGSIDGWSNVMGTSGSATGHATADFYTSVVFQPVLTTTEVTSSPQVTPASFTDSATLTSLNMAASAVGTVAYNLYSGSTGTVCTGTPLQTVSEPVTGGVVTNATFTNVGVGSYEIQAVYSGDPLTFNLGATSSCGSEPFTVNPAAPTVTTQLSSSSVNVPGSFTDTATVSGGSSPTGTVTFNVYTGSTNTSCTGTPTAISADQALSGGTATSGAFTLGVGSYEVQAVYSGDGNNVGASSACGTEPVTVHANFTNNLTPGFWKNHSKQTTALLPQTLGTFAVTTFSEAQAILSEPGCGSAGKLNCMNTMLLSAELNLAQGGSTCIVTNGVLAQANALDVKYNYAGPGTYNLTGADKALAQTLHDELSAYNIDGVPTC